MRRALYVGALLAIVAAAPQLATSLLDAAAATLIEAVPFLLTGAVLVALPFPWRSALIPFAGCGCSTGASARSIPAAVLTGLLFGPVVAGARFLAANLVTALRPEAKEMHDAAPLGGLHALLLPAIGAGAGLPALTALTPAHHLPAALGVIIGSALGFIASPCGLGACAVAGILRGTVPGGAAGFLAITGIADLRTLSRRRECAVHHDALAYAIAAVACFIAALHAGGALVNPRFVPALACCAPAFALLTWRFRNASASELRIGPAIMLAGTIFAAPPPIYHATETTLADAFPGERIDFRGLLTRTGRTVTLVRYAITCCRADAAPVVLALTNAPSSLSGWVRATGTLIASDGRLRLRAERIESISPPRDPFVYR